MRKNLTTGFWEPGRSILADGLAKEERARLAPLEEEIKKADDPAVKERLKADIRKIQADFREKRRSADRSLFARA